MSNPFADSVDDDVLYPDDLEGRTFELLSEAPVPAEEVPHDNAQFGDFIEVSNGEREYWISAPRELRRLLGEAEAEPGHTFRIDVIEKGPQDHDPYEIDLVHEPERT